MKDRISRLELIGHHAGMETNFSHAVVAKVADAMAFADRACFPGHGFMTMGCVDQQPAFDRALIKRLAIGPA